MISDFGCRVSECGLKERQDCRGHAGSYSICAKLAKADSIAQMQRLTEIVLEKAVRGVFTQPEAAYAVTSTSLARSREFDTPLGRFSFSRVPQKTPFAEVRRIERDDGSSSLKGPPPWSPGRRAGIA